MMRRPVGRIPFRMRVIGGVHQPAADDGDYAEADQDAGLALGKWAVEQRRRHDGRQRGAADRSQHAGAGLGHAGARRIPFPMPVVEREIARGRGGAGADRSRPQPLLIGLIRARQRSARARRRRPGWRPEGQSVESSLSPHWARAPNLTSGRCLPCPARERRAPVLPPQKRPSWPNSLPDNKDLPALRFN